MGLGGGRGAEEFLRWRVTEEGKGRGASFGFGFGFGLGFGLEDVSDEDGGGEEDAGGEKDRGGRGGSEERRGGVKGTAAAVVTRASKERSAWEEAAR